MNKGGKYSRIDPVKFYTGTIVLYSITATLIGVQSIEGDLWKTVILLFLLVFALGEVLLGLTIVREVSTERNRLYTFAIGLIVFALPVFLFALVGYSLFQFEQELVSFSLIILVLIPIFEVFHQGYNKAKGLIGKIQYRKIIWEVLYHQPISIISLIITIILVWYVSKYISSIQLITLVSLIIVIFVLFAALLLIVYKVRVKNKLQNNGVGEDAKLRIEENNLIQRMAFQKTEDAKDILLRLQKHWTVIENKVKISEELTSINRVMLSMLISYPKCRSLVSITEDTSIDEKTLLVIITNREEFFIKCNKGYQISPDGFTWFKEEIIPTIE